MQPDELEETRALLRSIYYKVERLFIKKFRTSGEPYFHHLLQTAFIRLEESYNDLESGNIPDIIDIFYCLLHDIVEDTDMNFIWLNQAFGKEIAFGTHLISKHPFQTYIGEWKRDKSSKESDNDMYIRIMGDMKLDDDNIGIDEHIINEEGLNPQDVEDYKYLRAKYRVIRSVKHFEKYLTFDTFFAYAKSEAKDLPITLPDDEIREICHRIIQVKLCDRLHNLRTMSHMDSETIKRKIWETEKYLLPIALETNPVMHQKLVHEIKALRDKLELWEKASNLTSTTADTATALI